LGQTRGLRDTGKEQIKAVGGAPSGGGLSARRGDDRDAMRKRHTYGEPLMASGNDMKAAEKTYSGFIGLLKWTIPVIAVLVIVVILLIS
jgi:hypothetical protein